MIDKSQAPKLLLDEQLWVGLAALLRKQGFDVVHVDEVGLAETPDPDIFRAAVEKHRAVVTFNIRDFIPLAREYARDGKDYYGIVVSNEISKGELQRRVTNLLENVSAEDLKNIVRYLQEFK